MSEMPALAERLVGVGVRHAFGVTGSGDSLRLISELERHGAQYHPAAHEAAAALMAGGVTQATRTPAVSIAIKGPGLANMLPGMLSNRYENVPAISVSEAYGGKSPRFRMHKRLDHDTLAGAVVKRCGSLLSLDQMEPLIAEARSEVPGPVHIDLNDAQVVAAPAAEPETGKPASEVLDRIARSKRPMVVVGSVVVRRGWTTLLRVLGIPVFTTAAAKGAVDETSPPAAGVYTGAGRGLAPEARLLSRADLVVGIGLRNLEVIQPVEFACDAVLLDVLGGETSRGFNAEIVCVDPAGEVIEQALSALAGHSWGLDEAASILAELRSALAESDWHPSHCFTALNEAPFDYDAVLDTGLFCTVAEHVWAATAARRYFGSSNGRFMGVSLPTAVGIASSDPKRPIICVIGDGGIRMYPAELRLAVADRLPLCVVLMRDGTYASVACIPQSQPTSSIAVRVRESSWRSVVEAMGCEARSVSTRSQFQDALLAWQRDRPLFIEAVFDPMTYRQVAEQVR